VIQAGSIVIVSLTTPKEKYWGKLGRLDQVGVELRGLELNAVLDWARETAKGEPSHMGLATVFFPLGRVEKIFLDEATELIPSISEQARNVLGGDLDELLSG
jgi:hypothetical protein